MVINVIKVEMTLFNLKNSLPDVWFNHHASLCTATKLYTVPRNSDAVICVNVF